MSRVRADSYTNSSASGPPNFPHGFTVTGVTTLGVTTFSSDVTINGDLYIEGTQTVINTTILDVEDKNVGIGSTTTPTDTTIDGGGLTFYGATNKTFTWDKGTDYFTFSNGIDIGGAVETIGTASTSDLGNGKVELILDAHTGTVFEHDIDTNGIVGIVSLSNFPNGGQKNGSATTYTVIFTQGNVGMGNTTDAAGITTNIILQPYGQASFASTTAKVGSGTTVTLSTTAEDADFVSFLVRSGSASTTVYATANKSFRY